MNANIRRLLERLVKETSGAPSIILMDGQPYKVIPTSLADDLERALLAGAFSGQSLRPALPPDEITMGVGTGDTGLFIHGSYEAIERVRKIIAEWEQMRKLDDLGRKYGHI